MRSFLHSIAGADGGFTQSDKESTVPQSQDFDDFKQPKLQWYWLAAGIVVFLFLSKVVHGFLPQ